MNRETLVAEIERLLDEAAAANPHFAQGARRLFDAKLLNEAPITELADWLETLRGAIIAVRLYTKIDL